MSRTFPELDVIRVTVDRATRDRHLAALTDALSAARLPSKSRFRLLAVAVAVLFLLPALALAAERAEPGDLLYPVRQVLPWISDHTPEFGEVDSIPAKRSVVDDQDAPVVEDSDPARPDVTNDRDEPALPERADDRDNPRRGDGRGTEVVPPAEETAPTAVDPPVGDDPPKARRDRP